MIDQTKLKGEINCGKDTEEQTPLHQDLTASIENEIEQTEARNAQKSKEKLPFLHDLQKYSKITFDKQCSAKNLLMNEMLELVGLFYDEDEAKIDDYELNLEDLISKPRKAIKKKLNDNSYRLDRTPPNKEAGPVDQNKLSSKFIDYASESCSLADDTKTPNITNLKSRFKEEEISEGVPKSLEAKTFCRSESSWSSSEESDSEEDLSLSQDRLLKKPQGGIDDDHCKRFVLANNEALNEVVDFLESFFSRDVLDAQKYQAFDIYQRTIVDLTLDLVLTTKPDLLGAENPSLTDGDFKPKRNDEKSKIIMSLILKSVLRKYRRKLKIREVLRKKNLYLAIYYHFAYKGENYKLVSQSPDMEVRYKLAENAFRTHKGLTKSYVRHICPALLDKIIEIGSNFEYMEQRYNKRVSTILFTLFKSFDRRCLAEELPEYKKEPAVQNKIPNSCYFTILSRLTSKTMHGVVRCKLPVSIRFIRRYTEFTLERINKFRKGIPQSFSTIGKQ